MSPVAPKPPIAEANRLSKLLSLSLGAERFPVDVESLALEYAAQFGHDDPITNVIGDELPGFEGALYPVEKKGRLEWALLYNSTIEVPGRIRFTVAHELGHYILHRSSKSEFECSEGDMLHWESVERQIEADADAFAATLLMPIDDFRMQLGSDSIALDILDQCAKRYGVSLTAAVLKWLEFTSQRAVLVMSRDGYILWARSSQSAFQSGAFFKTKGRVVPVPEGSLASSPSPLGNERDGSEVNARVWFPKEPKDMALREMKLVSDKYEQTMSLLILPKAEPNWLIDHDSETSNTLDSNIRSGHMPRR